MATLFSQSERAKAIWLNCLTSALRTAVACIIVGCITLFGPASLQHQIAFPAFSYVTVILIVTDATLGDTLKCCWLALYASFQSLGPAILSLWLIGPARFSSGTTALAVALGALIVVLPEKTHLIAKRIALGQIVIVYVIAYIKGLHTESVMHPIRLAASTAIGVLAFVLSMLVPLPLPSLACLEVKHNCKLHAENARERLRHLVKAFCAEDNRSALASITLSKSLASTAAKFLQSVKRYQESMKWEKLTLNFLKPKYKGNRMQDIEVALRGMEMALISIPTFPVRLLDEELKDGLLSLENHISLNTMIPYDSLTIDPESISNEKIIKFLHTLKTIPQTQQDLPSFFFFFCTKLLNTKLWAKTSVQKDKIPQKEESIDSYKQNVFCFKVMWSAFSLQLNNQRLMAALKCSLSLGFAVLCGLIYSKENGYWAGLPVAISFASTREATFRVANVKAQGTVLGTVYGVLGCFVFERLLAIRFLSLLPWFILTSFLHRSRMYGQAGGISAVIGALLILGRKNFGPPSEFAIARIIETFIGLSCSVMVDLLFQPRRAATLAKAQLSKSLGALQDCINSLSLQTNKMFLKENQKRLRIHVNDLNKFIEEADAEPNFWFLPFHNACYVKLLNSLSKMMDLLLFSAEALEFFQQQTLRIEANWKDIVNIIDGDLESFKKLVGSSVKCFEEATLIKSFKTLEKELQKKEICCDLELGKLRNTGNYAVSSLDGEEIDKIISCYLQHSKEVTDKINVDDEEEEIRSQVVISLCALEFCISSMLRETREIEKEIQELAQLENPSVPIKLYEISYMIHALQK